MSYPALKTAPERLFEKPFALSIGPQRSGTSWIDRYLRSRKDICLPTGTKELYFFDRDYGRGLKFYKNHFDLMPAHRLVMEITTTSFDNPKAAENIHDIFGSSLRLICPLRHPVTRSYSLYLHYKRYGMVKGNLQESCEQNPQILDSSNYAKHIERWLHIFGTKPLHFMFQEDMEENLPWFVTQLCNNLQIPVILPNNKIADYYNAGTHAAMPGLGNAAFNGANFLRKYKMYPVINAAKKMGFKDLLLGAEKTQSAHTQTIPEADHRFLEDRLLREIENLEKLIGPIPQWS